jgi:hypothetical protein
MCVCVCVWVWVCVWVHKSRTTPVKVCPTIDTQQHGQPPASRYVGNRQEEKEKRGAREGGVCGLNADPACRGLARSLWPSRSMRRSSCCFLGMGRVAAARAFPCPCWGWGISSFRASLLPLSCAMTSSTRTLRTFRGEHFACPHTSSVCMKPQATWNNESHDNVGTCQLWKVMRDLECVEGPGHT